ncbi:MAG: DUF3822 family protein [Algoriphagus sp.]|nr:DUF3822 family protein [Algoriphagus sp.]
MENNLKVFKSDKFDVEDTASLSLFLYPDSLYIFAKDKNQANIGIHFYAHFNWNNLEQLILSDQLLRNDVPAKIYLHHDGFSLVPGVLFSPGNEETYLTFSTDLKKENTFFSTPLDSNNLQVVSFIPDKIKRILKARFSEVSFYHGACSFLSYLFKERFNLIGQEILLSVFGTHMYAAVFVDQELSAFNMFEITDKEDILKYSIILINQLKLDRNHVRLSIFGASEMNGITEEWCKKYFHHARLINPHANQNYSHGFKHLKSVNLFETNWQFD